MPTPGTHTVAKVDTDRRLVFGWASVVLRQNGDVVVDSYQDVIAPDDLETAAYNFVLGYRELNERHAGVVKGHVVESMVVTPEKLVALGLSADALPTGWWVGFHVDDDAAWEKVKKGEYTMFSIEGSATREAIDG